MRLFIAIDLPEAVRRHLDSLMVALKRSDDLPRVTWVKRENWHVTLKFLGEVDESRVTQVQAALATVPVEPATLCTDRMVYFPKRGPVRVIAAGIGGDVGRIQRLQKDIEQACASIGFSQEDRSFSPHITLGRSRTAERGSKWVSLRQTALEQQFPGPMFHVEHFSLVRSELRAEGSKYTTLQRFASDPNIS